MSRANARTAHVLGLGGFAPRPGQVAELASTGPEGAARTLLDAPALDMPDRGPDDDIADAWLRQMASADAGVHERMTWFWHGHFTSARSVVDAELMWEQHETIRRHAMGNFRELAQALTIDPAMLIYLDGDRSQADNPNENFAREVMELFTIGVEPITEADVRGAAKAFAGWEVDRETGTAAYDPAAGYAAPLTILGEERFWSTADVVDHLCDHPALAPFIVRKLHHDLVGDWPTDERLDELSEVFRASSLDIATLVEAMLLHPDVLEARSVRAKYPIEWFVGAAAAVGVPPEDIDARALRQLGQVPFDPPNVGGWPPGDQWVSAASAISKLSVAEQLGRLGPRLDPVDPIGDVLDRCSIFEPSTGLTDALGDAARAAEDDAQRTQALFVLALLSPEFAVV